MAVTEKTRQVILAKSPTRSVVNYRAQKSEIMHTLRSIGVDWYCLHLPETHSLPQLLKADEKLRGVLYGKYQSSDGRPTGRGMLVATNQRMMLIDKKPLFLHFDEIMYDIVSGLTYSSTGFSRYVTVHTRMSDIKFRTISKQSIAYFVAAVETEMYKARKGVDNDFNDS